MEAIATSQDQGALDSVPNEKKKERNTERVKVKCYLSKMLGPEGLECRLEFQISASSLLEEHTQSKES